MPTLEENKKIWDVQYNWSDSGEEWSNGWGTSTMQWFGTLLPRIHPYLPVNTILEIGPGFGRWTEYLKNYCTNLNLVDLSEKCISACKERFKSSSHISCFVNDGTSLDMIQDNSIDFIFSFDSLVHAEDTVISAYLSQFPRKLKQTGVAFIHHSNLGEYSKYFRMQRIISRFPKLQRTLIKLEIDGVYFHWRAPSMTAQKMKLYSEENGLQCITQELVNWGTRHFLIDCISTIVKKDSIWSRDTKILKNQLFMKEAINLLNLSSVYSMPANIR